jgi:hypothetical protein
MSKPIRSGRVPGHAKLTLSDPGEFANFYVFSTEHCGSKQFWKLLERLMAAAGRPILALETLRQQGLNRRDVTRSAMRRVLRRQGYGFGIFFDVDPAIEDIVVGRESHKLLFLRDPRHVVVASYLQQAGWSAAAPGSDAAERAAHAGASPSPPLGEFLQSPAVEHLAQLYRRYAELWRQERNVTLFRYERALSNWHEIAAEIVATLKLPLDPLTATLVAAEASPVGDRLPSEHPQAGGPSWTEDPKLEARFADVLAAFGYARRGSIDNRPPRPSEGAHSNDTIAVKTPTPNVEETGQGTRSRAVYRLGAIFERDPVLQARLRPNASIEVQVLGQRVIMEVDALGCRPVVGQRDKGERTLAAYGCSCTYGNAIAAEETFCSLLQGMFPEWRIENHGVPAYSTSQNLLQLERESRWNKAELVTFCWIEQHLNRNVADVPWVQEKSRQMPLSVIPKGSEQQFPRATLDRDGLLQMGSVRLPRHDLIGIDFSDFAPNEYYLDLVCFRLFERANAIVTAYGGHFFVTTLVGHLSAGLARRLADSGIPVVAASLSANARSGLPKEFSCLPDDGHPNGLANRIYAERIRDYLLRYTAEQRGAD